MDRVSLDRFAVGLPDPQDKPNRFVCMCACGCRTPIYEWDVVIECMLTGDLYASERCFVRASDARRVLAGTREVVGW